MDNFNLKKFLIENKLTPQSQLSEVKYMKNSATQNEKQLKMLHKMVTNHTMLSLKMVLKRKFL
jgi:hypothetical protein